MPSAKPIPTVRDFLTSGRQAVTGQIDDYADTRSGSIYDHINGPSATLAARQAIADRDKFRAIYLSSAQGSDLTALVQARLGVPRILGTYGAGTVGLARPTADGGDGTFWAGTRIQVPGSPPSVYQVSADTPIGADVLTATVPIEFTTVGTGGAVQNAPADLLDPVWDASWSALTLTCAAGTSFEDATTYLARARATLTANRNGYLARLQSVLASVGAVNAIAFASNTGLPSGDLEDDGGIGAIYVGDANFGSTSALVQAAAVALESYRALGADLWVGGVAVQAQPVVGTVNLTDSPGSLPQIVVSRACLQAALGYFPAFSLKVQALESAIASASPYVQQVTLSAPATDTAVPAVAFSDEGGTFPHSTWISTMWPGTITLYVTRSNLVNLTLAGPT